LRTDSADAEARAIEVIWTTDATVRWRRFIDDNFDEELMIGACNADAMAALPDQPPENPEGFSPMLCR